MKNALLSQANESGDLKRIESICKWCVCYPLALLFMP